MKNLKTLFTISAAILALSSSQALATKKVYSPYVEKGELEFEYRGNYTYDNDRSKDGEQENKFAVGYGFTDYWFTELYAEIKNPAGDNQPYDFEAIEWENKFQLTQQGEYWLDLGLLAEYEYAVEDKDAPDEIKVLALVQKDIGKFSNVLNIGLEKQVGENSDEGFVGLVSWSTRYRWMPELEPGFEIHSNFGEIDDDVPYSEQEHQVGPVLYGNLGHGIKYDVGYLFGVSRGAPDGELKFLIEYGVPLN